MSLRTSTDTAKIIVNTVQCKNLVSDCFHVRSVQNCVRNVQDVLSPSQPAATSPDTAPLQCRLLLPRAQLQPEPEPAAMSREDSPLHCNTFANYTVFYQKRRNFLGLLTSSFPESFFINNNSIFLADIYLALLDAG